MNKSHDYIYCLENRKIQMLMLEAYELIFNLVPQVVSVFKWKTPFFEYLQARFCYLHFKKDSIYISFMNMTKELVSNEIEIEHLKSVSKVYISDLEQLRSNAFHELIIQAAIIHEKNLKKSV